MPMDRAFDTLLLCASEALTNCVEHAEKVTQFQLQLFSDSFGWWLDIKDDGKPSNIEVLTEKLKPSIHTFLFDGENEGGRGLGLISTLTETIELYCNQGTKTKPDIQHVHRSNTQSSFVDKISSDTLWCRTWVNGIRLGWQHQKIQQQQTVLLVDDDPSLIALYRIYLQNNYHVISVENGQKAYDYLQKNNVDIVISDINMPVMNGIELRQLLNQQGKELTPFIFLTTADNQHLLELATSLGIDDYLNKPITKDTLLQTTQRVLTRSRHLISRLSERIDQHISSALAPALPNSLGGWEVNYQARNTGLGGGDFVIYHQYKTSTTLVLVDIMGHNDVSKFFSYAYGGYIKGLLQAHPQGLPPHQLLEILSNHIYNDSLLTKTTLTCLVLSLTHQDIRATKNANLNQLNDTASVNTSSIRKLTCACAGHPPPLLIGNDTCQPLSVNGMLAGLLPNIAYSSIDIHLTAGQKIAIYTDGLFEACNNIGRRQKLYDVIQNELVNSSSKSGKDTVDRIFTHFDKVTHHHPTDDALLIILQPNIPKEEIP